MVVNEMQGGKGKRIFFVTKWKPARCCTANTAGQMRQTQKNGFAQLRKAVNIIQ